MTEQLQVRRTAELGTRHLEVLFEGKWVHLGGIGTTFISDNARRERYHELSERVIALLVAAPDLLGALERIKGLGAETPAMGRFAKAQEIARGAIEGVRT